MKKSLSVFVALAMVLSLFAGVGTRSARAAVTLTVTPSGNFVGGIDARGATPVDAVGTVASITDGTHAVVDLSLIHISEPTRLGMISYAVFCLKKKKQNTKKNNKQKH